MWAFLFAFIQAHEYLSSQPQHAALMHIKRFDLCAKRIKPSRTSCF